MGFFSSLFKFICRFISEFVRFILFFASIFFMLVSVLLLLYSFGNRNLYKLIQTDGGDSYFFVIIALAIYLICLAAFGIYGTFFRSKTSIEWFSLLASLNVVVGVGVFIYISPRLGDSNQDVTNKLTNSLPKYDWFNKQHSSEDIRNATLLWNKVQQVGICCGVDAPKDWDAYRPKNLSTFLYPSSCCLEPTADPSGDSEEKFCYDSAIWNDGCATSYKYINSDLMLVLRALIFINLILSLMACVVICCGPNNRNDYYDYS